MNRFEAEVQARGMTVFAHVDHAAAAAGVGLDLRPTDLLVFGAAVAGTPVMQSAQTIGIDLPLKALVWCDEAGAAWLAERHGVAADASPSVHAMRGALEAMGRAATTG